MKTYWSIPGPSRASKGPCIAFFKYDGSNLRFEWTKKKGWWKFGTRKRLFDASDPEYGGAIELFNDRYAEGLERVFRNNKEYRGVDKATVFCEWFGISSFAGWHDWDEEHEVVLFDVEIHKKGFVLPRDFLNHFGHLKIPDVIYEGNFSTQFIQEVREGYYQVAEGVVVKGVIHGKKKNDQHGLWMSKVKTDWWLRELKQRARRDAHFRKVLMENIAEQEMG